MTGGSAPGGYAARPSLDAPPGTVQCPNCHQYSRIGMACEFCSTALPLPARPVPPPPMAPPVGPPGYPTAYPGMPAGVPGYAAGISMTTGEAFFRRLGAHLIDYVLMNGVGFVIGLVLGVGVGISKAGSGGAPTDSDVQGVQVVAMVLQLIITGCYAGAMYSLFGRTLGKMALGLRVVGPGGGNPSFFRGAFRDTLGKMISACICAVGYLAMLWDDQQQTWHDQLFSTTVERA